MSWPNLSTIGASIHLEKANGSVSGVAIIASNAESVNEQALLASGFIRRESANQASYVLPGASSFKMSDLDAWFRGFDRSRHIDREAGVSYIELPQVKTKKSSRRTSDIAKIEDVGEKLGGAKKDLAKLRDYSSASDEEKSNVRLSDIWAYSYKEAYEKGVACSVAVWIYEFRKKIPPAKDYLFEDPKEDFDAYVNAMRLFAERLSPDKTKTPEDLLKNFKNVALSPEWATFRGDKGRYFRGRKALNFLDYVDSRIQRKYQVLNDNGVVVQEVPRLGNVPPGRKYIESVSCYLSTPAWLDEDGEEETRRSRWMKIGGIPRSRSQAENDSLPDRPHLDSLKNDWDLQSRIPGVEITADLLLGEFGFRGIEFGEWLPQDERQIVIDQAYFAFKALAAVLGLPDKAIGLNGALGIAFGARGSGKYAAHYEPDRVVINLTRIRGAGSLAHEWAHALDHHVGKLVSGNSSLYMSTLPAQQVINQELQEAKALQRAIAKFKNVMRSIRSKPDADEAIKGPMEKFGRHIQWASSWMKGNEKTNQGVPIQDVILHAILSQVGVEPERGFDRNNPLQGIDLEKAARHHIDKILVADEHVAYKKVNDFFGSPLDNNPERIRSDKSRSLQLFLNIRSACCGLHDILTLKNNPSADVALVPTNYSMEAEKLDKKRSNKYWGNEKELFARAFESFVFDELESVGRKQEYLVHGVEGDRYGSGYRGNPYPAGEERVSINRSIRSFVDSLEDAQEPVFGIEQEKHEASFAP